MKNYSFTRDEIFNDYWGCVQKAIQIFGDKALMVTRHGSITFAAANQRSNVIFSTIKPLVNLPGSGFGLYLKDPLQLIPAMIGVLKAKNYITVLDVNFPELTLLSMIETGEIKYVLTTNEYIDRIHSIVGTKLKIINLDELNINREITDPVVQYSLEDIVQLLFTSGSTGQPKGAIENYRYLCRAVFNRTASNLDKPGERILQLSRYTFSGSHLNLFSALVNGFTTCYFDVKEDGLNDLPNWIREQEVTCYTSTPTIFRSFVNILSPNEIFPKVRTFKCGAEKRLHKDIQDIRDHFPGVSQIQLGFAATETHSVSTALFPRDFDFGKEELPSGMPRNDIDLLIWDENGNIMPTGQEGEIVVHGDALVRGYINNPQLTQDRFIQDPLHPGWQYFKTGDLGKIRADGQLVHLGRIDNMVKIKGIRIELDSIENHILSYQGIAQVASRVFEDSSGNKKLALYFVSKKGTHISISDLRKHLTERLPGHLLPHFLIQLDELPVTDSGKVARNRLPQPSLVRPDLSNPYVPPQNEIEKKLIEIWEKQIGISGIGITDNFFEVGGDSLLAAILFVEIEQTFGVQLPLRTLIDHETIRKIAALISDPDNKKLEMVVAFSNTGKGLPVFLIPHGRGDAIGMRALALLLKGHQPVYGLQAVGIGGQNLYSQPFGDIASKFVQAIRAVQPQGPYRLIGGSIGGIVAYEMACILSNEGEHVGLLGMVDTSSPGPRRNAPLGVRLRIQWRNLKSLPLRELPEYVSSRIKGHLIELARKKHFRKFFTAKTLDAILGKPDIRKPGRAAHILYSPRPYTGDAVMFKAKVRDKDEYLDPVIGWRKFIRGEISVVEVEGNHNSVYSLPDVAGLAKAIMDLL